MFGRRRKKRDQEEQAETGSTGTAATPEEQAPEERPPPKPDNLFRAQGPWDASEDAPKLRRIDFGSLQIPMVQDVQVQLNVTESGKRIVGVTLVSGKTLLQVLPPQAAPKSTGLWAEVREEVAAEVARNGGRTKEFEGTFGPELRAVLPVPGKTNDKGEKLNRPVRFIGVDGPRWLLRGVMHGEGAVNPQVAARIEEIFQGIVVVRGEQPAPPKSVLTLRMPPQTREALARAQQQAAQKKAAAQQNGGTARGSTSEGAAEQGDAP